MRTRLLSVVLVFAVLLTGCTGVNQVVGGSGGTETTAPTTDATTTVPTTSTPTPTATPTTAPTTSTPKPTDTSTPTWSKPQPPNTPKEGKYNEDNPMQDENNRTRLYEVAFVNWKSAPSGDGYSDFDMEVHADTRMPDVDPASHGSVRGEPYFLIYANGELIYRSDIVEQKNGTFLLDVHPGSLEQFDDGNLDIRLYLMDRDSTYDDEYAIWKGNVDYASD